MIDKIRDRVVFVIMAVAAASMFMGGCTAPSVSHTSISGEVRNIEHWRIVWIGAVGSPAVSIPGLYEKSKYTAAEYCLKYVDEVKQKLTRSYNRSFAENFPDVGVIEIELTGNKLSVYVPTPSEVGTSGSITWEDRGGSTRAVNRPESGEHAFIFGRDKVRRVRLRLFDLEGNPSGDIFIGDSHQDNVKPDFVAKVIDEILRTGKYKGTKVLPLSTAVEED